MAKNQVTLTFAGDKKLLDRTIDGVGASLKKMEKRVEDSSSKLDDLGGKAGKGFGLKFVQKLGPLLASAPVTPQLVGVFAAAAPLAGAALAGGILLALGGGVLAAGIMSAMKDPKVSKAFGGLKERAGKAFADFGTPFKAPLIRAADTFGDTLERIAPAFKRMGATMAPLIDKLAPALATMFEKAMPGIEKAVAASVPLFEKLAEHAPAIGEAVSKFFTKLAQAGPGAADLFGKLLKFVEVLLPALGNVLKFLVSFYQKGLQVWLGIFRAIGAAWTWLSNTANAAAARVTGAWRAVTTFVTSIPGRIRAAFAGIAATITAPFRSAFNGIARAWNNTVGRLSFTIPGWVPGIGGNGWSAPNIPTFHKGGTMPGAPGSEGLALLQAGEKVTPAGRGERVVLEIRSGGSKMDDLLVEIMNRAIRLNKLNVVTP